VPGGAGPARGARRHALPRPPPPRLRRNPLDLIAASIYHKYSVGPSIRPICTRFCFTMTNMIQVCSNFRCDRVFIINTRPDEMRRVIASPSCAQKKHRNILGCRADRAVFASGGRHRMKQWQKLTIWYQHDQLLALFHSSRLGLDVLAAFDGIFFFFFITLKPRVE